MGEFHYEFFGPLGTCFVTFVLPVVIYALSFLSNKEGCLKLYPLSLPRIDTTQNLLSWEGIALVYAWFFGHLLLHAVLPAKLKEGVTEPDGKCWLYRLNGVVPRAPAACDRYLEVIIVTAVLLPRILPSHYSDKICSYDPKLAAFRH
jgi:hypothetical protein